MGYWNPKGDEEAMVNIFKVGIAEIHRETDKVFIEQFLRGRISEKTYALFLSQLYHVYTAMESELRQNSSHSVVGPVYFPEELTRVPSLEKDLEFLYGNPGWRDEIQQLPTTKEYVARILEIGKSAPELLMAHVFTRYMGDLFGGQILKRKWRKMFGFPENKGVLFYTFDNIDSVPKFREFIEVRVNGLELELKEKYRQLEEMKLVFKFNTDLVIEILQVAKNTPGGFLPPQEKQQTWAEEVRELSTEETSGCVFATKEKTTQGQCPVRHKKENSCPISQLQHISLPKYGLLLCATLAVIYPIAKKVWH